MPYPGAGAYNNTIQYKILYSLVDFANVMMMGGKYQTGCWILSYSAGTETDLRL
jgi:hypothetical protein